MARPEKCKRICTLPEKNRFICEDSDSSADTQTVSVEEFETMQSPENGSLVILELNPETNKYRLITPLETKKEKPRYNRPIKI